MGHSKYYVKLCCDLPSKVLGKHNYGKKIWWKAAICKSKQDWNQKIYKIKRDNLKINFTATGTNSNQFHKGKDHSKVNITAIGVISKQSLQQGSFQDTFPHGYIFKQIHCNGDFIKQLNSDLSESVWLEGGCILTTALGL